MCVCVSASLYDSLYDVGTLVQERVCVRVFCAWLRVGVNAGYAYFLLATKCTNVAYAYVIMFMCICAYLYVDRKPGSVARNVCMHAGPIVCATVHAVCACFPSTPRFSM